MTMGITAVCKNCGIELTLDCGEIITNNSLDLTLTCENDCGAPVLNAFVSLDDFTPVEG